MKLFSKIQDVDWIETLWRVAGLSMILCYISTVTAFVIAGSSGWAFVAVNVAIACAYIFHRKHTKASTL